MSADDLNLIDSVLETQFQILLVDVQAFPARLNATYAQLELLRRIARNLQRTRLVEQITSYLSQLFPPNTPVTVIDGAFIKFNGHVVSQVDQFGMVDVKLDIFGRESTMNLGIEVLQVRI